MIAAAARGAVLLVQPGLTYDGTYYLRQAERLQHFEYDWIGFPPGYPLAVAALEPLVGDFVRTGRLVSLSAGIATIPLFHSWACGVLPPAWAFGASIVLAVHPHLVRTSTEVLSEPLCLLLILAGFVLSEKRKRIPASLCLGWAFLCRPEALVILLGLPVLQAARDKKLPWTALLPGLVLVLAYAAAASVAVGHPVITPKQGQLDLDADLLRRVWTWTRVLHAVFPLVLLPGALAVGARWEWESLLPTLYLWLMPLYDIHIQERLFLPALPFLFVLGLMWVQALTTGIRRLVLAGSALLFVLGVGPGARQLFARGVVTPRAAAIGAVLRPHLAFDDRVAGRFPFVAYYAGAGFVRLPLLAYSALLDSMISLRATHLLVLESEIPNITPHLKPLLYDAAFVAAEGRLEAVAWVEEPPGDRAILYRLHDPAVKRSQAPVRRTGVAAVTWLGESMVAATAAGLEVLDASPSPNEAWRPLLHGSLIRDVAADDAGRRLVFVQGAPAAAQVTLLDVGSGAAVAFPVTQADDPVDPIFVGDHILYVRTAPPGGIRALDPRTLSVRDVALSGLDPARAVPLALASRDSDIAITYARRSSEPSARRVIATATWPGVAPNGRATAAIELPGRWATEVSLAHDALAWVPGSDRLLASIAIHESETDEPGAGVYSQSSLCVLQSDGLFRRLTFDIDAPRQPELHGTHLAFLGGPDELRAATLALGRFEVPRPRVFQPAPPLKP